MLAKSANIRITKSPLSRCFLRLLLIGGWVFLGTAGCQAGRAEAPGSEPNDRVDRSSATRPPREISPTLADSAAPSVDLALSPWDAHGIDFLHQSGGAGEYTYPEILCGGVCIADFNGDHSLDVYFPQGGQIPGSPKLEEPNESAQLFLNDGSGQFNPAPQQPASDGFGMGAFAVDVDNDDDLDLLLTNVGKLRLLLNRGDATFADNTSQSGIPQQPGFWLNAAFGDYDGDRNLDVYVANYVSWHYGLDNGCTGPAGRPDYCAPKKYEAIPDLLLLGDGTGKFVDVSEASGITSKTGRSMGVVALDVELDGDLDIYVACDGEENLLWINQGDGTFTDEAMIRGTALNASGMAEASMGIACADLDADGDEDLILSHLAGQTHTVYRNDGGYFVDDTAATGLGSWSRPDTGFGICLVDFDNDRHLDLLVANGAVIRPTRAPIPESPYAQPDRLAKGTNGRFPEANVLPVGSDASRATVTRGLAYGDLDGDGRVDAIVAAKDSSPIVLKNQTETNADWIGIRPVYSTNGPAVLNTRVDLLNVGGIGPRTVRPHSSYLGSSEDVVRFGLADHEDATVEVVVTWPDGTKEEFSGLETGKVHILERGSANAHREVSTLVESKAETLLIVAYAPQSENETAPTTSLPPFPTLTFEPKGKRDRTPVLDQAALDAWCKAAGLPAPPQVSGLDAATWELVHPAIKAAGEGPNAKTLGDLAKYYDGHGSERAALELYRKLVSIDSENHVWWHLLGINELSTGNPKAAINALIQSLKVKEDQPATRARLAEAHLRDGNTERAIRNWQRALATRKTVFAYTGLAQALEANQDFEGALKAVEVALGSNPKARPALVMGARLASRMGQAEKAKEYGQRASELTTAYDPVLYDEIETEMFAFAKPVEYLRKAIDYYKSESDFDKGYEAATALTERRPNEVESWQHALWFATAAMKQNAPILDYAKAIIDLDPEFGPAWEILAREDLAEGRHKEAGQKAVKALRLQPDLHKAYLTLGLALGKLGRFKEANQSLDAFLKHNPPHPLALQMKAACHVKLGEQEAAQSTAEAMLKIDPDSAWAKDILEQLKAPAGAN